MRFLPIGLAIAGLLHSQMATAACMRQTERPAFDVVHLKSELMVTAISCKANDRYNAFISRYRSNISENEKSLNTYFARNYGRQAQKQHDSFITSLANAQSQQGLRQGTLFCDERTPMFDEVMALQSAEDLPDYARGKDLATPDVMQTCSEEPGSRGKTATHNVAARKRKR